MQELQITVETLTGLERRIKVILPEEELIKAVDKRLIEMATKANIPGFRPGKAPLKEVRRRYESSIRDELAFDIAKKRIGDAIESEQLHLASAPALTEFKFEPKQPMEFAAVFEVYPDFELATLEKSNIEVTEATLVDADIDKHLAEIQKQHATWNEVSRAAKEGDQLKIDFVGTVGGEKFQGGEASDIDLVLGSKSFLPEFEGALKGAKTGDNVDLDLTFPDNYSEELAGKEAHFAVKVHSINEAKLPELNDDFAKSVKVEGGIAALKEQVSKYLEEDLSRLILNRNKEQIVEKLLELNSIEVPKALINEEVSQLHQQATSMFQGDSNVENTEVPEAARALYEKEAKKRVTLSLLMSKFIEKESLKPDADRVKAKIELIAGSYEEPDKMISFYYQNDQACEHVERMILEEQIIDTLIKTAKTTKKEMTYTELKDKS